MKANSARLFNIEIPSESASVEDAPPPVRTGAEGEEELAPRVRKNTFDVFNEEMSALDRPLEAEVEYYDEPRPRRWKVPAIGLAIFVVSCAGGYLALARLRAPGGGATTATTAIPPAATTVVAPAPPSAAPAPPGVAPASAPLARADARSDEHHHHRSRHAGGRHHHHASGTARRGHG
jgi:hypothetical protein